MARKNGLMNDNKAQMDATVQKAIEVGQAEAKAQEPSYEVVTSKNGKEYRKYNRTKKILTISLHEQYEEKLRKYCDVKQFKMNAVIERLIDENCNL